MENKDKLFDVIKTTTDKLKDIDLNTELSKTIQDETGIDLKKAKETVEIISSTIDLIDKNYQDLKKAKDSGKSRKEWLLEKLDEQVATYSELDKNKLVENIKISLDNSNQEIGTQIFNEDLNLTKKLPNNNYDGLNKQVIVDNIQEQIKNNTLLGAIVYEDGAFKIDENHKEIEAVKKYYEEKLDSKYDLAFKKATSVAFDIAKENNLLPDILKDKTSDEVAILVDRGLTTSKLAYKVANGEINQIDAVEYTIDRSVSVLNSIVVATTTKYGGQVGTFLGSKVGAIFGPVGAIFGAKIGNIVGKYAGRAVGTLINKGVSMVASGVKSVVKSIGSGIKAVGSTIASWLGF